MSSADELSAALQLRLARPGVPEVPEAPVAERRSRWTPARLREAMQGLPATKLYPELASRVCDAMERWYHRFPLRVWSRFVHFADSGVGRSRQLPKMVKEFNEVAPALDRLLAWVERSAQAGQTPVGIVDLCSGFGFLSMFAAELLDPSTVEKIYMVDSAWPNRGLPKGTKHSPGTQTVDHIYGEGASWPIPLVTLCIELKKGSEIKGLAQHVIRDPWPTIICGIHLCGTLSLRAIQLFNDGIASGCGVIGLILAPCCLPRRQHARLKYRYAVGSHTFSAQQLHEGKEGSRPSEEYSSHLFLCADAEDKSCERVDISHKSSGGGRHGDDGGDPNTFFFMRAPFLHAGKKAGTGVDFGRPVVIQECGQEGLEEGGEAA